MKSTIRRIDALRFALGEAGISPPTMGVAGPLEKAALIVWRGWRPGMPPILKSTEYGRGWYITEKGKAALSDWVER
jgi:hypothetical protein